MTPVANNFPQATVAFPKAALQPLDHIENFLARFIAYPSEYARVAHALWIAHAHIMDAWESTPRIAFLSPEPGSGKSRALEVTELLVPRPVQAINVTPAYMFRKVGSLEGRPTILFDEIDTVFGPKARDANEEIRGLLNAGHRKASKAGRCVVVGREIRTEELPAYCAVALAGLGDLPDTILTRSVIVRMRRRAPGEIVEPFRQREHGAQGEELLVKIEAWAASIADAAERARPIMPAGVIDRDADVWEPLIAVADAAGGTWPHRARAAATALVAQSKTSTPSLGIRLLADLRTVFADHDRLTTESIIRGLCAIEESPWGDIKGHAIDARGLAQRLKPYNVTSKNMREGTAVVKGYARAELTDSWQRYLPAAPPVERATCATPLLDAAVCSGVAHVAHAEVAAPDEELEF